MSGAPVEVVGLTIRDAVGRTVVDGVSVEVPAGATLGVVGESGSGKTTLALSLLGVVRPGLRATAGAVMVDGLPVLTADRRALRRLRRRTVSYLGQDPAASLNPTMRVGRLVSELLIDRGPAAQAEVADRLSAVGLPADADFARRYPHQLSGGQQQRVALARSLANDPSVLVLDEPTTGLDVVIQELVLTELAAQRDRLGLTTIVISHDLAVVARLADEVIVIRAGAKVDQGEVLGLFSRPAHDYTAALVSAVPDPSRPADRPPRAGAGAGGPCLEVVELSASYQRARRGGAGRRPGGVPVVAGVSLRLDAGECLALVGPSGSGKTTIARCVAGLHRPDRGHVALRGTRLAADAARRSVAQRGRIQLVPQDPYGSLNPRRTVGAAIARPLRTLRHLSRAAAARATEDLLDRVRLRHDLAQRYPRELSGGERQRVAIARALAAGPELLVCDEVTSALDVSVQAGILQLLDDLRAQLGLTLLFITHDFGVVARIADRVAVLDGGRICEQGPGGEVLARPEHEATRRLLAACRSLDGELARRARSGTAS